MLACVAFAAISWQRLTPDVSLDASQFAQTGELVTSYLRTGVRTQFANDGRPSDVLAIDNAQRWEGRDETALSGINFYSESEDGAKWFIDSTSGLFFEDSNELFLQDGVEILETTRDATMTTESMWLFIDDKRAVGQRDVIFTGSGSRTSGTGFELDLVRDIATLKGRVKTDYE
jgi:LPS export ABC transporter protein LptC